MTWEDIFPFVLLFAVLLLQLVKIFRRPVEDVEENKRTTEAGPSTRSEPMKRPLRTRPSGSSARKEPSGTSPSPQEGTYKVKRHAPRLTVNAQEARRGIVLMTVVGPCRAFDPPNPSQ